MAIVTIGYSFAWSKLLSTNLTRSCECLLPESIPGLELKFCPTCGKQMYKSSSIGVPGVDLKNRRVLDVFKLSRVKPESGVEIAIVSAHIFEVPNRYSSTSFITKPLSPEFLGSLASSRAMLDAFLEENGIEDAVWGLHAMA